MNSTTLFYIILTVLLVQFLWDIYLNYLNSKHFNDAIPQELDGVFNEEEYLKSQNYKLENYSFSKWQDGFSFIVTFLFILLGGFAFVDEWVRKIVDNPLLVSMIFIFILMIVNSLIGLPFSYYDTFVIEEKFGFNKSTKKIFWLDTLKGLLLSTVIGGVLLWAILWFYQIAGKDFWWYAWILFAFFAVFFNLFYSQIIVPLFNKQTPLEEGELKNAINEFAKKAGFKLDNIFVIDGSKRSTKANAYFAGFGPKKRIVLYDTLINELTTNEIVAVLAHEIGHYKKNHTIYNLLLSLLLTGFTLFLLGFFVSNPMLSNALGVETPSFHIGLIAFGILYSPISEITGLLMSILSRKFEYQADNFAKTNHNATDLISGLKKLSKTALSNLTPHPLYVFWHYSHPTLLQRIQNLNKY